MKAFSDTAFAYKQAHRILWQHGYWRYLLLPLALSIGLMPALLFGFGGLSYYLGTVAESRLSGSEGGAVWLRWLVVLVMMCGVFGTGYVLYRNLVLVCYGPFLERLSMQAERTVIGHASESERPLWESLLRPLTITLYAVLASIGTLLLGLLLGFIPLIGSILSFFLFVPTQLFLGSVGYVDPYLERRGFSPREAFAQMRREFIPMLVFSIVGFLFLVVPLVGWFLAPTYSVVAGIVFGIRMLESDDAASH
ncbi:EI24 domain-containing protein [Coraliomargarita parva]|uniref:EI24 domain-containing protein n=1 Tax=Coraliomargarita parva TaxID=3014050 RepID=UPI0022B4965C|nr:EI24 domain-containing protein [Coraliomargarita parva]